MRKTGECSERVGAFKSEYADCLVPGTKPRVSSLLRGYGQTCLHDLKEAPSDEARATEAVPVIHQIVVRCEDPAIVELGRQWVSDIGIVMPVAPDHR